MTIRTLVILTLSLIVACCSDRISDTRLTAVEELASTSPKEALDSLEVIDYALLSDADKHYYDFLSVKVSDKAYITHTSDSLILKVIDYESRNQGNGRYPEALYYGGRVYSDLGDSPTALDFFQKAIEELPSESMDLDLKCRILSQTGRLLTTLRLYEQAEPYIQGALEINRNLKDTINIIYNLQLLGVTYLRNTNYKLAEDYFKESLYLSRNQPSYHAAKSKMYIAAVKYKLGDIDSALCYIHNTSETVKPIVRNSVLGYASNIYLKAGILDTAYYYAKDLISNENSNHQEIGYQVLLSPELRNHIELDTLYRYISEYRTLLENFYDENKSQLTINQQNFYNYQLHEKGKENAEKKVNALKQWIIGFVFIIILLALTSLYLKNKSKNNIIELQQALNNIEKLKFELVTDNLNLTLSSDKNVITSIGESATDIRQKILSTPEKTEQKLRDRLRNELMSLYESSNERASVSPIILQSNAYQRLQEFIHNGKNIKENDILWSEIEQIVLSSSPKFMINLNLLTLGNLTNIDLHTALLIKCGIKPSKMTTLLGRSNGAIVSRRETLSMKIFDEKKGVKVIDGIIRLL